MELILFFLGLVLVVSFLAGPTIYQDWKKSHSKEKHA